LLDELFTELKDYTVYHFGEEERLMAALAVDPRHTETHCEAHQSFLENVQIKAAAINSTDSLDLASASDLLDYLVNWLAFHILGEDKNLAHQIEAIKAGVDPATAYDDHQQSKDESKEPLLNALHFLFNQVSQQNRELQSLNGHLEDLIESRTFALSQANHRLQEIAYIDSLTSLPNRRSIASHLEGLWEMGDKLSCLMIDADHFKEVNDTYGHGAGDIVLKELAVCLEHTVRSDDVVGRMGGDEFLVVCSEDHAGAHQLADKLKQSVDALSVKVGEGGGEWQGSISIGYASRAADVTDIDDLIRLADKGVYLAKKAGKDCVRSVQTD
jgi:hemerythrin